MKIVLDARNIKDIPCGLGNYCSCLVKALMDLDKTNEYIVILNSKLKDEFFFNSNFKTTKVSYDIVSIRNILFFHKVLNKINPDVYHALHGFIPFFIKKNIKTVLTIHDLKNLTITKFSQTNIFKSIIVCLFYKLFHKKSLSFTDLIIAISNYTAYEIYSIYGSVLSHKIKILTHSLADIETKLTSKNNFKSEAISDHIYDYTSKYKYILSLGNSKPHKNIESCIQTIYMLKQNNLLQNIKLFIVGRQDRKNVLIKLINKLKLINDIFIFNKANDQERNILYKNSLFLAFPSKHEGLGMPILEAMKFQIPVLTSNITATKEIAGDAALLVDPYDFNSIYEGFKILISNGSLRFELVKKGTERLKLFSWPKYSEKILEIYNNLHKS